MSGRDVRRVLEAHDFALVRQRGSHMVLQRVSGGSTVTTVVPDHDELRIGTLLSVIRQSRLPRELFEA
ncbi:MAG TPA: type II toxin-antitoxin system HicA family toxin [Tepidisphaeraceae bacterium]|nr:type II toxin-antitoxin system HicA family toxin [Tepidisphaeraceae bacterium]